MNPFLSHPRDRMRIWRELRASLDGTLGDMAHLEMVTSYWTKAPISTPYLDYMSPSTWPDAWGLLDSNDFDQNAIGLGMFYTLLLSRDGRWVDRLGLSVIRHMDLSIERMVVVVDGRLALNYDHGAVSCWPPEGHYIIMHDYTYDSTRRVIRERPEGLLLCQA